MMKVYSIWEDAEGDTTLVPGEGPPRFADGRLQAPGAKLVEIFEAATFGEAVVHYLRRQGQTPLTAL